MGRDGRADCSARQPIRLSACRSDGCQNSFLPVPAVNIYALARKWSGDPTGFVFNMPLWDTFADRQDREAEGSSGVIAAHDLLLCRLCVPEHLLRHVRNLPASVAARMRFLHHAGMPTHLLRPPAPLCSAAPCSASRARTA